MKLSFRIKRGGSRSSSRRMEPAVTATADVDPAAAIVRELTATFKVFDKNGDGKISKTELGTVLSSLGDDLSDEELDEVILRVDGDGDGCIDLEEFISFHQSTRRSRDGSHSGDNVASGEEDIALQAAFDVFDADKNGFISAEELQRVLRSLGEKHTSLAECRHMINCVDKDGDHMVDFNEFQCLMSSTFVC